jgi:hypothetical protein
VLSVVLVLTRNLQAFVSHDCEILIEFKIGALKARSETILASVGPDDLRFSGRRLWFSADPGRVRRARHRCAAVEAFRGR